MKKISHKQIDNSELMERDFKLKKYIIALSL